MSIHTEEKFVTALRECLKTGNPYKVFSFDLYRRENAENLSREAFAHMFCNSVQNPESLNIIKRYFPKSYNLFKTMINGVKDDAPANFKEAYEHDKKMNAELWEKGLYT